MKGEPTSNDPGVMSTDEMRHWLREFLTRPEYGWLHFGGRAALGKLFYGNSPYAYQSLMSKLRRSWIVRGERGRFHRLIMAILDGKVVFNANARRSEWVANPVPVRRCSRFLTVRLVGGQLRIAPQHTLAHYVAPLPKFSEVFSDVPKLPERGVKKSRPEAAQ